MKTVNIKGKEYVMVNERIKEFRKNYPNYSLISDIVNLTEDSCIIKASVLNENGVVIATGLAQEDRGSSMINKTSFIENCETSAWGRALGNLGIGIDTSIASAEEVDMAIKKQESQEIIGGAYILRGGKYDGQSIDEVLDEDEGYIEWCIKNAKNIIVKQNMEKAWEDRKKEILEVEV